MERHHMTITDCCFDIYGTLIDTHTEEKDLRVWEKVREQILLWNRDAEPGAENLRKLYFDFVDKCEEEFKRSLKADEHGEMDVHEAFEAMLKACDVVVSEEAVKTLAWTFREASSEYTRLYDGAIEFLTELKKAGKKLWVISNAQTLFTLPELEMLGISDLFDGIYISSEASCKKPDKRFYQKAIEEEKIDPAHAVMIGNDGICDIKGGRDAGMYTIYFMTNLSPEEEMPDASLALKGADYPAALQWILEK